MLLPVVSGCRDDSESESTGESEKNKKTEISQTTDESEETKETEISQATEDTGDETSDTKPKIPEGLFLFGNGKVYYKTVIAGNAHDAELSAATKLNKAFHDAFDDWNLSNSAYDYVKGPKEGVIYDIKGKEILVGVTNRKQSHEALSMLSPDRFMIKAMGEKLVIIGYDAYCTLAAVDYFNSHYLEGEMESLLLDKDLEIIEDAPLRKISINREADYRIMTYNLGLLDSPDAGAGKECVEIITRHLPDIMGLQECNAKVHNEILANLPEFYAFANKYHSNGKTVNYTPIIYNTQIFTCVESKLIWLRGRYTGTNTKSLNWAVLEDNDGNKFALINYHGAVCGKTYAGFENYTAEQIEAQALAWRLDNVVQIIEIKNAIIAKYGNIPVMVSGDNNFNNSQEPYQNMIAAGFSDAETNARLERMSGYKTSYSYGKIPGSGLSIDHIFGIGGVDFVVHAIVRGEDVWKASDHCPVYVDFSIKK